MPTRVDINTDILTWAISRAGFELNEFAVSFPKVLDWIDKEKQPTVKQLEEFSKKVHLPFGYLFLDKPPIEKLPIPFFRTGKTPANQVSIEVYDTILLLQKRQEWLSDYLKDNDFERLEFVGKFSSRTEYSTIVNNIRKTLGLKPQWAGECKNVEEAKNLLSKKIEKERIIISFNSVVNNSTRRKIEVDECRGFVLVDEYAPFMFINSGDAKSAQLFTMVHELAHIWIGESAGFDNKKLLPAEDPIEKLCDQVAAEFLVPELLFKKYWEETPTFKYLAFRFKVSQIVIARRALDLGIIKKKQFFSFYREYIKKIKETKAKKNSGGDFMLPPPKGLILLLQHLLIWRYAKINYFIAMLINLLD